MDKVSLAVEKTRYVGDPVAAVAAVEEETAEAALKHIQIEYKVLEPVMSIPEGLAPPLDRVRHVCSGRIKGQPASVFRTPLTSLERPYATINQAASPAFASFPAD